MITPTSVAAWTGLVCVVLFGGFIALKLVAASLMTLKVRKASRSAYSDSRMKPSVSGGSSYGWSKLVVSFASKEDFKAAEASGNNAAFLVHVQQLYADQKQIRGTRAKPKVIKFNAEYAVTFRYPGYEAEEAARFRELMHVDRSGRGTGDA